MHVWPIYTPMLLYLCIHMIHTYRMTCLIDATYYGAAAMMRRAMRVVFTLGLAFATGGSFGESTEGTSTRFGVEALGIAADSTGALVMKVSDPNLSEN